LVSATNISSLQDFLTVAGNLFGSPLFVAIILLLLFALIAVGSHLDATTVIYLLSFYLFGVVGWNKTSLGFTQAGITGELNWLLVLYFIMLFGVIGFGIWIRMQKQ
jgi:hypothetical protein